VRCEHQWRIAVLKRAFHLGKECTPPKVRTVPFFPMLKESDPRSGFLEPSRYAALAKECARVGLWLRAMFEVGHSCGWRHGEVLGLRVRQIDLLASAIRLDVGSTKNNEGREVAMTQAVRRMHSGQRTRRKSLHPIGAEKRRRRRESLCLRLSQDLGKCMRCGGRWETVVPNV
jgi:integrase